MFLSELITFFRDQPEIEEIFINGFEHIFVVGKQSCAPPLPPFQSNEEFIRWLQDLSFDCGLRLDPKLPYTGGSLSEGTFRWHAILPPVSSLPLFCIRRHLMKHRIALKDFGVDPDKKTTFADLLYHASEPILICGPTGSGKSSLLAALFQEFCINERICLLELVKELPLTSPKWIRLVERQSSVSHEGRVSVNDLYFQAMRLRPDRIVVGEIRTPDEAKIFLDSSRTGHLPSLSTLHADSAANAKIRLQSLVGNQLAGPIAFNCIALKRDGCGLPRIFEITKSRFGIDNG